VGITIQADNVDFDLAGHRVFGQPGVGPGNGIPGIIFDNVTGSRVRNGTVSQFDTGVYIEGGGNNEIRGMQVTDNVGGGGDFSDGIQLFETNGNRILNNQVLRNATQAGIVLYDSSNNLVDGNNVANNGPGTNPVTIGIWVINLQDAPRPPEPDLTGLQASFNVVSNNTVVGNGLEGIQIARFTHDNTVINNNVVGNGTRRTAQREGDGIAVFGNANHFEGNQVFNNAGHGIGIVRTETAATRQGINNRVLRNNTRGNGFGTIGGPNFDLFDGWLSPPCDNNLWRGNTFQTFNQPCVTAQ
jgi:parallel beta-helix repeat protein